MGRAFMRAPSGVIGMLVIGLVVLVAIVAPLLWAEQSQAMDLAAGSQDPSAAHPFGTDQLGRDILLRVLVGARLSLSLAIVATLVGAGIGTVGGVVAASLPRRLRSIALRVIDSLLAFPAILIAIFVSAIVGPGALGATLGVGLAASFGFARMASALTLAIGGREYIAAARVLGIRRLRVLARYVLPNVAETLVIGTTVAISSSLIAVSSLSFLGLGVGAPAFDWGRMLTEGVQAIYVTPVAALAPALAIAITALAFGFAGEALARAMNPTLWTVQSDRQTGASHAEQDVALAASSPVGTGHGGTVLTVRDLVIEFPGPEGYHRVVDGVTFTLHHGDRVGIVGESGSGKTMTALAIMQLVPFPGIVHGSVVLNGQDLALLRPRERDHVLGTDLAVVYQDPQSSLNPALTIGTQLVEGAEIHRHLRRRHARAIAIDRLREVNMPAPAVQLQRHPHQLSGGMRQRVMIAMGLMNEPAVLVADEPTTALDVTIQAQIMDVLERINQERQAAVVLISHNLGLVSQNCNRVLVMYAGRVVEDISVELLRSGARHPYTRALLGSVPSLTRPTERLEFIAGQSPDPANLPTGCPFHPRCLLAVDRCRVERPPLEPRAVGGAVACWVADDDV
jgi:peptide/nickel transport system permease protein